MYLIALSALAEANATATGSNGNELDLVFILGLALSGISAVILTFIVQHFLERPKLKTALFELLSGSIDITQNGKQTRLAFFAPYVYITNQHDAPIYVLDYELELDFGDGYRKLERVYGQLPWKEPMTFNDPPQRTLAIPRFGDKLIDANARPVSYGDIIRGFVVFFHRDITLTTKRFSRMKFTCIDAFQNKHTVELTADDFLNSVLFDSLVGAARSGPVLRSDDTQPNP